MSIFIVCMTTQQGRSEEQRVLVRMFTHANTSRATQRYFRRNLHFFLRPRASAVAPHLEISRQPKGLVLEPGRG